MQPLIQDFRFGRITVDGITYKKDLILLPDGVLPNWWRAQGHALAVEDLLPVFDAAPETLIVGLGVYSRMRVADETCQALEEAGISLISQATGDACETYNCMREASLVAAALHLTC